VSGGRREDSAVATAQALPAPAPGSTRYFVLLYCPRARRLALATLLSVADEIGAGLRHQTDHAVAHARLEWWRQEAQRFARGAPEHPWLSGWLRADPADRALELGSLTDAAAIDLAQAHLGGRSEWQLYGALFVLAARLLAGSVLADQHQQGLRELGQYVARREHAAPALATRPALQLVLQPALQPQIVPLLVWSALAERQAQRRERAQSHGVAAAQPRPLEVIAANLSAWKAARQALRGRFRLAQSKPPVTRVE
jgi:hypothetical protein